MTGRERAAAAARPRPLRATDLWVSAAAVRQAIGAWAYTRAGGAPPPGDDVVRAAVAVAGAVAECAADAARADVGPGAGPGAAFDTPVAVAPARLAELTGLAARDVARGLEVLRGAGVLVTAAGDRVTLSPEVLAPCPAAARVAWGDVRRRLAAVGAGSAAPLAVLRALAERLVAHDGVGDGGRPAVRASVRELEDATRFARSTVSDAVAALVRARVLDADTRAGHTARFALRPAAFGAPDDPPDGAPAPRPADSLPPARPTGRAPAAALTGTPAAPAAGAAVLVGTFAGTPIYAPPGTPLVVECDAHGRWVCRVGPLLQLGPVEPPAG